MTAQPDQAHPGTGGLLLITTSGKIVSMNHVKYVENSTALLINYNTLMPHQAHPGTGGLLLITTSGKIVSMNHVKYVENSTALLINYNTLMPHHFLSSP